MEILQKMMPGNLATRLRSWLSWLPVEEMITQVEARNL